MLLQIKLLLLPFFLNDLQISHSLRYEIWGVVECLFNMCIHCYRGFVLVSFENAIDSSLSRTSEVQFCLRVA